MCKASFLKLKKYIKKPKKLPQIFEDIFNKSYFHSIIFKASVCLEKTDKLIATWIKFDLQR